MKRFRLGLVALCGLIVGCGAGDDAEGPAAAQAGGAGGAATGAGGQAQGQAGGAGSPGGSAGVSQGGGGSAAIDVDTEPTWRVALSEIAKPAPPSLLPCPDGWSQRTVDAVAVPLCEPPTAPQLIACPEGWSVAESSDDVLLCEPPPLPSWSCPEGWQSTEERAGTPQQFTACGVPLPSAECEPSERLSLAEGTCEPMGPACPQGDFPDDLDPSAQHVFVKPGATGGDGSAAKPLASIAEAVAAASEGAIIVLARGTHAGGVVIDKAVTLRGACVGDTVIDGGEPSVDPTIAVTAAGVVLSSVTLRGDREAVVIKQGGEAALLDVQSDAALRCAVRASGGTVTLERASLRGTRKTTLDPVGKALLVEGGGKATVKASYIEATDGMGAWVTDAGSSLTMHATAVRGSKTSNFSIISGRALLVTKGATATVSRSLFDAGFGGAMAEGGATLSLDDVAITRSKAAVLNAGVGLLARGGAHVEGKQVRIDDSLLLGVFAFEKGTSITLDRAIVHGTKAPPKSTNAGHAVGVESGASVTLTEALLDEQVEVAASAINSNSKLALKRCIVARTAPAFDGTLGAGLFINSGGSLELDKTLVEDLRYFGVGVVGGASSAKINETMVRRIAQEEASSLYGSAVDVELGAEATIKGSFFVEATTAALYAINDGSKLDVSGSLVARTRFDANKKFARGIDIEGGADGSVDHTVIHDNGTTGLFVEGKTSVSRVDVTDVRVTATRPTPETKDDGSGFVVRSKSKVTAKRVYAAGNVVAGVTVLGPKAELTVDDLVVRGTKWWAKDARKLGLGLDAEGEATLTANRVLLENNGEAALTANQGAIVKATDVVMLQTDDCPAWPQRGAVADAGSQLELTRALVQGLCGGGLASVSEGTVVTGTDVTINDMKTEAGGVGGVGVGATEGGAVSLTRASITNIASMGVVTHAKGSATLTDVEISDLTGARTGEYGVGVAIIGGTVTAERLALRRARYVGMTVLANTDGTPGKLTLTDFLIDDVKPDLAQDDRGDGIVVTDHSEAILTRGRIDRVVGAGVELSGGRATIGSLDVGRVHPGHVFLIDETGHFAKTPTTGVADGILLVRNATCSLSDVSVARCGRAGLLLSDSTSTMTGVTVSDSQFGLVLRGSATPGYDMTCSFDKNQQPILPNGDLPVPNAPMPIPSTGNIGSGATPTPGSQP